MYQINEQPIYHEKQEYWQCGLHAVNNILQLRNERFKKEEFDKIANDLYEQSTKEISMFNPHKSMFIGNYDANVLIIALQRKNYQADYYNQSKNKTFSIKDYPDVQGFILNTVSDWLFFSKKKHWIAILKKDQFYYNLDSKQDYYLQRNPEEIEIDINNILKKEGTLLIVKKVQ
ncbi:Josephin-1 [Paramecium bursaria]